MAKATKSTAQLTINSIELASKLNDTDSEMVSVLFNYPKDWNKNKFFLDGEIKDVHKSNAEIFITQGIATFITE